MLHLRVACVALVLLGLTAGQLNVCTLGTNVGCANDGICYRSPVGERLVGARRGAAAGFSRTSWKAFWFWRSVSGHRRVCCLCELRLGVMVWSSYACCLAPRVRGISGGEVFFVSLVVRLTGCPCLNCGVRTDPYSRRRSNLLMQVWMGAAHVRLSCPKATHLRPAHQRNVSKLRLL